MYDDLYILLPAAGSAPVSKRFLGNSTPPPPQRSNIQSVTAFFTNRNTCFLPAASVSGRHVPASVRRFFRYVWQTFKYVFGTFKYVLEFPREQVGKEAHIFARYSNPHGKEGPEGPTETIVIN
ncbi:MAG: hypothetical protein LBT48_00795 [Prevotellaceae bacterium]|nr:hypothetical protein [Prevotellaceae bacterium]